jgi:hypothetical protein
VCEFGGVKSRLAVQKGRVSKCRVGHVNMLGIKNVSINEGSPLEPTNQPALLNE